jgi:putative tryptophan/tyrosine transport system substrate-binding protein
VKRRDFIIALGGAAATWPLVARAQQSGRLPIIGLVGSETAEVWHSYVAAFEQRLRELGWGPGRNVTIEYRWAEGHIERFAEIVTAFVRMNVDVMLMSGSAAYQAKQITSTVPIVMVLANDPVGAGLVASLARPGGNITGVSIQATDLAGKRLELLRQLVPDLSRVAVLTDVGYPAAIVETSEVRDAARKLGLDVVTFEFRRADEIAPAFAALKDRAQAVYLPSDPVLFSIHGRISALARDARMPLIAVVRDYVDAGALMSYGPDYPDQFRHAAEYVDKILRGTKPSDLPVEQPTKFALVINLKAAKALGLTVPTPLLATADEVIE